MIAGFLSNARILIIDDEASAIQGLMGLLTREGYVSCIGMTDPVRALEEFPRIDPDLILLDWHMNQMSGLEAVEAIKRLRSPGLLPPVIVFTAIIVFLLRSRARPPIRPNAYGQRAK